MFDPEQFMQTKTTGPLSTKVEQCPEGQYPMMIDSTEKTITFKSGTRDDGSPWVIAEVQCVVQDEAVKKALGRDKVTVRKSMFVDIDPATGTLDTGKGKNVQLGQFRDAVGQNDGKPWSWQNLLGAGPFIGTVNHRADKNDPETKYAEVGKVAPASKKK